MTSRMFAAWMSKSGSFTPAQRARFGDTAARCRIDVCMPCEGALVAADAAALAGDIALVGTIFPRDGNVPLPAAAASNLRARGHPARTLIDDYWGDYVAIGSLCEGSGCGALRAPFGDLPCYWQDCGDYVVLASAVHLLTAFGAGTPRVDWQAVSRFLAASDLRDGRTCLDAVGEVGSGQTLQVSSTGVHIAHCWSPWRWTARSAQYSQPAEAADALRRAIDTTIATRLLPDTPSVLLLSGGLDSSVVAAALSAGGHAFSALTMAVADRQGDERAAARIVADHLGSTLVERLRDPGLVDLSRSLAAGLPRPTGAPFRQATFAAGDALAAAIGATHLVDGGGGDNMFCSLQSATPVADALLIHGPRRVAVSTAMSIARMANVSVLEVLWRAFKRIGGRRHGYRWPIDRAMLAPDNVLDVVPNHPWLLPPPGTLPGKAAQVGLLLAACAVVESPDPCRHPRILSPLVAQPIAEIALRVPSWMWFADGYNRAIVRQAYAARLPAPTTARRSKGTPTGFLAALIENHSAALRPFLLDGLLAGHGVIDRAAVEHALLPGPARDLGFARLLQLADAEAWTRSWR